MQRSSTFATPARQQMLEHPYARLQDDKVAGPVSWLNPTRARFAFTQPEKSDGTSPVADAPGSSDGTGAYIPKMPDAQVEWRARDNRKGRHVLIIPQTATKSEAPQITSEWSQVGKGIWRMCTQFAWWDVSWWIAVLFTVGSGIFVASGLFYWLPLAAKSSEFHGEGIAGGVTSCVGATLFQIGAILLIVEACNENQSGCFGWAVEEAFHHTHSDSETNGSPTKDPATPKTMILPADQCAHHHHHGFHKRSHLRLQHPTAGRKWEWWPTWRELKDHYLREIGFLGSFILAVGSTVFYLSGIMALPWIYDSLSQGVLYGVYWLAYLVGGILFAVSSGLYMLETQPKWYMPAPRLLGWWIGTWNMIGSIGWTLSASFGYCSASWCAYQSDLSLLWASIAFMIGSALLWYESLDKYVVERERKGK